MSRAAVLGIVLLARVARADDTSDAERLYQEGQTAYDDKRYEDAIKAWEQSYAKSKLPALVFNLAQAHRLANHCAEAVEAYKRFLSLDPTSAERPSAEQFLKELEPCPVTEPVKPIEKPKLVETYNIVDRGGGKRTTGLIVGGTGVALFATGVFFGSRATSLANEVKDACAMGCEWATVEDKDASGRQAQTLQYVFLGAGAVAIASGALLYFMGHKQRETRVLTWVDATGGGAAVSGRF